MGTPTNPRPQSHAQNSQKATPEPCGTAQGACSPGSRGPGWPLSPGGTSLLASGEGGGGMWAERRSGKSWGQKGAPRPAHPPFSPRCGRHLRSEGIR